MGSPSVYIRKYTPENVWLNNIDSPIGAALVVDVPRGIGITSFGNNVFGSIALGALATYSDVSSTNELFQRNRAAIAFMTSSSSFYLPSSPQEGQVVIVVQSGSGRVTFYHPGKTLIMKGTTRSSGTFSSSTQGQFNFFVYTSSQWYGTYCNG